VCTSFSTGDYGYKLLQVTKVASSINVRFRRKTRQVEALKRHAAIKWRCWCVGRYYGRLDACTLVVSELRHRERQTWFPAT
jgi:hypothetical protein